MNTKNNQRARETDERIVRAVYRAITQERKPLARITVREVCAEAEINRSTFYAHYQDVYDVVEQVEKTMSQKLTGSILEALDHATSITELFERLFVFVGEYRDFYRIYLGEMHRSGVIGVAWELLRDRTAELRYEALGFQSQAELEYAGTFFISGLTAMLRRWLDTGCAETAEEMVGMLVRQYTSPKLSLFDWNT